MKSILKFSSLFSCIVALLIVAKIDNPCDDYNNLPFCQFSWVTWEEQVYDHSFNKLQKHNSLYEKNIKNRVIQLISHYKTGLKKANIESLSARIIHESKKYGYDPLFLTAVIITESSFYNWSRSKKGALGLMQIRPATGKELASEVRLQWKGKLTLFDPETNITLGTYYLNKLVLHFGDLGLALEAYNHGPSRVKGYLKKGYRPKHYSQKVFQRYNALKSPSI